MKRITKTIAVLLAALFIFQTASASVVAQGDEEERILESHDFSPPASNEPEEIPALRDEYTKHFYTPDGKYYASVHAQPVHYRKDGEWKDIDLTLRATEDGTGYAVQTSKTPVFVPKSFAADEKITVTSGDYTVGFAPAKQNAGLNTKTSARISAQEKDEVRYKNILSGIDFEYKILSTGIKENILVKEKRSAYRFVFDMELDGLLPVRQKDGSIFLFQSAEDEQPVMAIDAPFMTDAEGVYSDAVTLSLSGNRLTVTADADWINAEGRAFPVTIDPYLYTPTNYLYLHTGYVTNLHKNNNYVGKVSTGRNGLYADRTYFKFDFPSVPSGCTFHSASLVLYQNYGALPQNTTNYLRLYDLSGYGNWSYDTVTWNNQPVSDIFNSYVGTPYIGSRELSTATDTVYTFSLTQQALAYYAGTPDNGYLFALQDEAVGAFCWCGEMSGNYGTPPELRVYYIRPCRGCGDQCVFDTSGGESCPCNCASWEVCTCPQCGEYCGCGKLNCTYGLNCACECASAAVCDCVACNGSTDTQEDLNGNITSYTISDGTKSMAEYYTYNSDNAMTQMVDTNGNSVYYTYGAGSEQPSSITMGGATVNYTYNNDDLLTGVSQNVTGLSNGTSITNAYTYDTDENVTSITHNGFSYNFTYDTDSNNTQVKVGNAPLASYTYDTDGNLTEILYGSGDEVYYTYDSDGRVTAISEVCQSFVYGGTKEFLFTYDEDGNLVSVTDTMDGIYTEYDEDCYTVYYNGMNNEIHSACYYEETIAGTAYDCSETYGIWGYSRTRTPQEPDFDFATGETTYSEEILTSNCRIDASLVYDYFGRKTEGLVESTIRGTTATTTLTESIAYNDTSTTAGTLPTHYESTVSAGNADTTLAFRYTYDNRGNITAVYDTTTTPETLTAQYTYDEAGQLVREDNALLSKSVTYLYDKGGNLVTKTKYPFTTGTLGTATDTTAYTYDSTWKDQLASCDNVPVAYNEIGCPLAYTDGRNFEWNGRELAYVCFDDSETVAVYAYNENGLRSVKQLYDEDNPFEPTMYYYFWSDDNRLLGYTCEQPNADAFSVLVLYNTAKEPIGFTVEDETYYYIKNMQGDVLCVTDVTGTPLVNYTYDAWGAFTLTPASPQVSNTDLLYISMLNPATYRGYLYDLELGLYYLQSRYYDPEMGRFLSADAYFDVYGSLLSRNCFCYCLNNPLNYTDEKGYAAVIDDLFYMGVTAVVLTSFAIMFITTVPIAQQTAREFQKWLTNIIPVANRIPLSVFSAIIYLAKQTKQSKKSRSTDVPSWVNYKPPHINEKAKDYAKRILDEKYGKGNWPKGPGSEYNKIVKFATRNLGLK